MSMARLYQALLLLFASSCVTVLVPLIYNSSETRPSASRRVVTRHRGVDVLRKTTPERDNIRQKYVTVTPFGRLGNAMFQYASLIGVAQQNNLSPVFPDDHFLRYIFKLSAKSLPTGVNNWMKFEESKSGHYDNRTQCLNVTADVIELAGFRQSWKYFDSVRHVVRQEFTFVDSIQTEADLFIASRLKRILGPSYVRHNVILVGVHIRRGDLTTNTSRDRGYQIAGTSYIHNAMARMQVSLNASLTSRHVVYVICSDDPDWANDNIHPTKHWAVSCPGQSVGVDLAVLSLCDRIIMTVGSFGWWAAYLSGGSTIYYQDYARNNSFIQSEIQARDYFPPSWLSLSD